MIQFVMSLLAALVLTYAVSRLLLRTSLFGTSAGGLQMAHAASAIILIVLLIALKFPLDGFDRLSPVYFLICQTIWYGIDRMRERLPGSN